MKLKKITSFLDKYLDIKSFKDDSWNGLQFEGSPEINKIMFAVDAGIETFETAVRLKANMIVVHHGHFWKQNNPSITGWSKDRINLLYKNNISLYACHLPLDRHKEVGNNAALLKLLGAKLVENFAEYSGSYISWIGESEGITIEKVESILKKEINADCKTLRFGPNQIKRIAVCTGGGGYGTFAEALNANVDLYITGDTAEIFHTAKDAEINVMFAGHHATEILGVRELSKAVKKKFEVQTEFVDIPTGL